MTALLLNSIILHAQLWLALVSKNAIQIVFWSALTNISTAQTVKIISSLLVNTLKNITTTLPNIFTFIIAIMSFTVFLVWNGGIVLGDRSNHVAGLHFPQLFYYTSFLSFFAAPWTLSKTVVSNMLLQLSVRRFVVLSLKLELPGI